MYIIMNPEYHCIPSLISIFRCYIILQCLRIDGGDFSTYLRFECSEKMVHRLQTLKIKKQQQTITVPVKSCSEGEKNEGEKK